MRQVDEKNRRVQNYFADLYKAVKLKFKSQQELDQHRREGHINYSPHCPECKSGTAKQRPHHRAAVRQGGELSIDIAGPVHPGIPVTDRPVVKSLWPRYMLVGAFVPFGEKEAKEWYEQEVRYRRAAGLEGPIQLETFTKPNAKTMYFVELISAKK